MNEALSLRDRQHVPFESYCIVDAGFVRKRPDLVARVIQEDLTLFTTALVLWYIGQYMPLERISCRIFLIEDTLYPAGRRSLGVIHGRTVAYTALQVLVWLGFVTLHESERESCPSWMWSTFPIRGWLYSPAGAADGIDRVNARRGRLASQ